MWDPGKVKEHYWKNGLIQIKPGFQLAVLYKCWFFSCDKCAIVMYDVNITEKWMRGVWELSIIFANMKLLKKFKNL